MKMLRWCHAALGLGAVLLPLLRGARGAEVRFDALGFLPEGTYSVANGVAADGSVVVGSSITRTGYQNAFRWTRAGGMQPLAPEDPFSGGRSAAGISGDGNAVVGGPLSNFGQAFRWTDAGGMQFLGSLDTFMGYSFGYGASADGSVVVGSTSYRTPPGPEGRWGSQPFRWTAGTGMVGLGHLPGPPAPGGQTDTGQATGVSADGSVVVGVSSFLDGAIVRGAEFRWTAETGMTRLPGHFGPGSAAISADGSTIVGWGWRGAYRWTSDGGTQWIPGTPAYPNIAANDVSGDGSIVVGAAWANIGGGGAFIWDAAHGTRLLQDLLRTDYGIVLPGWTLESGTAISADGSTIAGVGMNPSRQREAWVVTVPEPTGLALVSLALIALRRNRRAPHRPQREGRSWPEP